MEKPKFTREDIDRWARDNYRLAVAVCQSQAFAECERKRVNGDIQLAENLQRKAEYELLKSGSEAIGLNHVPCKIDDRKKLLKILIGFCLCVQASDKNDKKRGLKQ